MDYIYIYLIICCSGKMGGYVSENRHSILLDVLLTGLLTVSFVTGSFVSFLLSFLSSC